MARQDPQIKLGVLDYMDHETVRVYDEVLRKITDPDVASELARFRGGHQRHADELDAVVERMGWRREQPSDQFKRFVAAHEQVILEATTQDETLEGLLLIEEANLGECRRTLKAGPPLGAADIVRQMCEDELRDVGFIAKHVKPMTGLQAVAHEAASGRGAWEMSDAELVIMLSGLHFMDGQTALAFEAAMPKSSDPEVAGQMRQFAEDHRRHVGAIAALLGRMGAVLQLTTEELQQYLHEAVAQIGRAKDVDDAMERLLLMERANAAEYESVGRAQMPSDEAMRLVTKHHLDEQHHVAWVEQRTPTGVGYGSSSRPGIGEDPRSVGL